MNNNSQQTIKEIKQKGNWFTVVFPNGDTMKVLGENNLAVLKQQLNIQRTYQGELSQRDIVMFSLLEKHRDCAEVKKLLATYKQAAIAYKEQRDKFGNELKTIKKEVETLVEKEQFYNNKRYRRNNLTLRK